MIICRRISKLSLIVSSCDYDFRVPNLYLNHQNLSYSLRAALQVLADFCQASSACVHVFVESDFHIPTSFTHILESTTASYKINSVTFKMRRQLNSHTSPSSCQTIGKLNLYATTFNLTKTRIKTISDLIQSVTNIWELNINFKLIWPENFIAN